MLAMFYTVYPCELIRVHCYQKQPKKQQHEQREQQLLLLLYYTLSFVHILSCKGETAHIEYILKTLHWAFQARRPYSSIFRSLFLFPLGSFIIALAVFLNRSYLLLWDKSNDLQLEGRYVPRTHGKSLGVMETRKSFKISCKVRSCHATPTPRPIDHRH